MAITPYYREKGNSSPGPNGAKMPGQNFHESQLLALKTRISCDPIFARYSLEFRVELKYLPAIKNDRIFLELVVIRMQEVNPDNNYHDVEILRPLWLQGLVDKWVNKHEEYTVIISDQYPIGDIPGWWLAEVMPRLRPSNLIQEVWFGDDLRSFNDYDIFYENGNIYIQLINPNNPDNVGPYTPVIGDLMITGEQAIKRGEATYGDYADANSRYEELHVALYEYLIDLHKRGVMALPTNSPLIKSWELSIFLGGENLYIPSWRDVRIFHYDGIPNLLQRQMESHQTQWDYQHVYFNVGNSRVVKHHVANYITTTLEEIPIYYDYLLGVKVSSYQQALIVANQIDYIRDYAPGSVIPIANASSKLPGVYYVEMISQQIIHSHQTEFELKIVPKKFNHKEISQYLKEIIGEMKEPKIKTSIPKKSIPVV